MRRLSLAVLLYAVPAMGAAAQAPTVQKQAPALPIDRIVGVVGQRPILWSEVVERVNSLRAQGTDIPTDSVGQANMAREILNVMADEEALLATAKQFKIEIPETEVQQTAEKRFKPMRERFKTDAEWRTTLRREGFGTEGEFKKFLQDQERRGLTQRAAMDSLRARGRLSAPVQVTEAEISEAFEKVKERLPKRPTSVSFKQLVIAPRPNPANRKTAQTKAEAIIAELKKGGDFEQIAKRESMDPTSKETGGDLGWNRRGVMVPEFDFVMFRLPPNTVTPVPVETGLGFHVIRVDRIQPAEVKARHILIMPALDSTDVMRAKVVADSALKLWQGGANYDSLVVKFHDNYELTSYPDAYAVDSLPADYKTAVEGVHTGGFTKPFEIPDPRRGLPKIVVLKVTERVDGGAFSVAEYRERIREQLTQERQQRRMFDQLRKEQFVVIKM